MKCKRGCEEMSPHFFTASFYFAFIWFRVQGSGFKSLVAASLQLYVGRCPIKNHSRPFLWKGADERSEAGLASPRVKISLHAANLRPFGAPPSKGRREKSGVR